MVLSEQIRVRPAGLVRNAPTPGGRVGRVAWLRHAKGGRQ